MCKTKCVCLLLAGNSGESVKLNNRFLSKSAHLSLYIQDNYQLFPGIASISITDRCFRLRTSGQTPPPAANTLNLNGNLFFKVPLVEGEMPKHCQHTRGVPLVTHYSKMKQNALQQKTFSNEKQEFLIEQVQVVPPHLSY